MTTVTGTGPLEMKVLAAKLHAAPAELKKDLRRELRRQAAPVVRAVKASIASEPSHHDGTLRKELARTVSARTSIRKTGASLDIVSAGTRMPAGKQNLNKHTDSARGWGHPVYPRGDRFKLRPSRAKKFAHLKEKPLVKGGAWTWVHQVGKPGWFEVPIAKRAPEFRAAAQRAIDDVKRKLET